MSVQERIEKVMEARRYYRELRKRGALPSEDAPLPELHPHHWEETVGIDPIPYEPGDFWYVEEKRGG